MMLPVLRLLVNSPKFGIMSRTTLLRYRSVMAAVLTLCWLLLCQLTPRSSFAASSTWKTLRFNDRNLSSISFPFGM